MALVECKVIKATTKDVNGNWVYSETVTIPGWEVVRESIFVSQETIDEHDNNFGYVGILYLPIEPPEIP